MKRAIVTIALALAALPLAAQAPDYLLYNGRIFTNDAAQPWAEAVAIRGNKIAAVGTNADVTKLAGESTRRIPLAGRVVVPGINDAHTHPGFAAPHLGIDRGMNPSWNDIAAALANAVDESPADLWIMAEIGPQIFLDPNVNRAALDKIAPKRKVWLQSWTGHGAILSTGALDALKISDTASDFEGGWYGRVEGSKQLDGRLFEYAEWQARARLADVDPAEVADRIRAWSDEAVRYGITSVQAMPMFPIETFLRGWRAANSPLRIRVISVPNVNASVDASLNPRMSMIPERATISGIKWLLDGTPVERGAAVRTPYEGGGKGRLNFDVASVIERSKGDQQLLFHAAGDQAVASLLDALEKGTAAGTRPRIEHGDGLHPDLFAKAKKTGAILVQNPSHFGVPGYPKGPYFRLKSALDAGIPIALGSDGPLNPWLNVMFATQHATESLTREQAVAAYTLGSAYAEMKENEKGKIAVGMLADLAVLSQNVFKAPAQQLPETRSVLTMINGEIVHNELPEAR